MAIKICKFIELIIIMIYLNTATVNAGQNIIVERYESWQHPILAVFKKYGVLPYKINYSKDGTCPTFYATFKYSPDFRPPGDGFERIYYEALKANSYYPYALVDKETDTRINVGWKNRAKKIYMVEQAKASSVSTCKKGDIDETKFVLNKEMKGRILNSSFKVLLHGRDGKKIMAYLYAENERNISQDNYPCFNGEKITTGKYFIYLYDMSTDTFFPERTEIFDGDVDVVMNNNEARFFVWPGINKNQPDILFISAVIGCKNFRYEAYGFSEDLFHLKQYAFVMQKKYDSFWGEIYKTKKQNQLLAYGACKTIEKKRGYLSRSMAPWEINLKLASLS